MALTDVVVRNAKPKDKRYKLSDERGLCLEVAPAGGKWWRLRYQFNGKEGYLSLGCYPDVTLKDARDRRDAARKLLAQGINPAEARKAHKGASVDAETFEAVAREWYGKFSPGWTPGHAETVIARLQQNVFPYLGTSAIRELTAPELLAVVRRIEARGAAEVARRVKGICGQVFRYAVATGRAERDPSGDLRGALAPAKPKHHAAVKTPKEVAALLRDMDAYRGTPVVRAALLLTALTFVRPGELRHAEWSEFDLEAAAWRIPGPKMKTKTDHVVPLSRQAVAVLRDLHPLTGSGRYVFPSIRTADKPMSENTLCAALRALGYEKGQMTAHGFRGMASTLLHEQGWPSDAIERQLAHTERNKVKAAYNHAEHMPERRKMMQAWADYLDSLRAGGKVLNFANF